MAETDKLNIDNIIARLLEGKTGRCALPQAREKKGGMATHRGLTFASARCRMSRLVCRHPRDPPGDPPRCASLLPRRCHEIARDPISPSKGHENAALNHDLVTRCRYAMSPRPMISVDQICILALGCLRKKCAIDNRVYISLSP